MIIALGVIPLAIAAVLTYRLMRTAPGDPTAPMERTPVAGGG